MNRKARYDEFEQMLRRSRNVLYRICLVFTDRHPDNVDDLYQEIVANLWQGWKEFRGESDCTTWVYRVALNTAGMELRKLKKKEKYRFLSISEELLETLAEEADPRKEELYELINMLSDDDKKLLLLHLDHLTNAQIAAIAGTSENVVKQRLYRIRKKLIQLHHHENA